MTSQRTSAACDFNTHAVILLQIIHLKVVDDAVASLRLSSTPVTSKQITQLLQVHVFILFCAFCKSGELTRIIQTCLRELLGQEHNDAYENMHLPARFM
jgi:hypothetical protein